MRGEKEWLYRCRLASLAAVEGKFHRALQFEGLDTFCDAYLVSIHSLSCYPQVVHLSQQNGVTILRADNMFRTFWVRSYASRSSQC